MHPEVIAFAYAMYLSVKLFQQHHVWSEQDITVAYIARGCFLYTTANTGCVKIKGP